jgi:Fur family transcriptional regulator, ferric uptake regulator
MELNADKMLKQHHLKVTSFRSEVVQLFLNSTFALPISEIEARLDNPDRITLYRTIKSFEDKGILHKITDGSSSPRYALCVDNCTEHAHADEHVHFHCQKCDNTFCLDTVIIPHITLPAGYAYENANMTVNGICNNCGA